jgi:hypothetical protein
VTKLEFSLACRLQPGQVFLPRMAKTFQIELAEKDLGQVLDGLVIRAESWRRTAEYLRTGGMPDGELFLIEECSDEDEADGLAAWYEAIIKNIQSQMEAQR